jgi:hypothetical protein
MDGRPLMPTYTQGDLSKRLLLSIGVAITVAACGASAPAETPHQVLAAAAQKLGALHTVKFDVHGTILTRIPPEVMAAMTNNQAQQGSSVAALANTSVALKGTGEAVYPDQMHVSVQVTTTGLAFATEQVVAGGKVYTKNPLTGQWLAGDPSQLGMQLNQLGPLTAKQILEASGSVQDLGDVSLNNVATHHYRITPDKTKLTTTLEANPAFADPQSRKALEQALNAGTLTFEVWISKDDHLLRSMRSDADVLIPAAQLVSGNAQLPAGAAIHITAHLDLTFHDFNAPVTITIPKTS